MMIEITTRSSVTPTFDVKQAMRQRKELGVPGRDEVGEQAQAGHDPESDEPVADDARPRPTALGGWRDIDDGCVDGAQRCLSWVPTLRSIPLIAKDEMMASTR